MKLVLATPLYPPEPGGPATYAQALMNGLPSEGIEVTLVKFSDVRSLPKVFRHVAYFWKVFRVARHADIVLALDPVSAGFPAILAAKLARTRFVVKIVGDFAWEQGTQRFGVTANLDDFVRMGRVPFIVSIFRAAQNFVARHAHGIIVPSEYLKGIVLQWGISAQNITVIYNSIELPPRMLSIPSERVEHTIVSVGRLVPWKHMDGIIEAAARVRKEIPDARLVIVGDGPEMPMLLKKGKELLGDSIAFTGAKDHEETLRILGTSGVFVLNSSYEGLSHVLIEALMLGSAIVATDAGGNSEVVSHEETGLIVPVGDRAALEDAILRLMRDDELRARVRARAKESAIRFSRFEMLVHTARLLSSVAGVSS